MSTDPLAAPGIALPPPPREALFSLDSRLAVLVSSLLYAGVIGVVHANVLSGDWAYLGFSYFPVSFGEIIFITVLITIVALTLPTRFDRPSALVMFMMHVLVFVPTVVITLGLRADSFERYWLVLCALAISFAVAGYVSRRGPVNTQVDPRAVPPFQFTTMIVSAWVISTALIIMAYGDIMRFASLDQIYEQRFAVDREISILGYVRSYYANFLTPALLVLGVLNRRYLLIALGVAGSVMSYMIDAQKAALLMPFLIVLFFFALRSRVAALNTLAAPILILTAVSMLVALFGETSFGDFLERYFFLRGIAIPGLTLSQYYDVFSMYGYTWWSNVSGINLLVPPPAAFANDPDWPAVGEIIGAYYYGAQSMVNANANPFAGEGAAAAGPGGILVIGAVFAAWLRVLDSIVSGWDRRFVLLAILPVASALTNAHLSTILLSFGGALWMLIFALYKPGMKNSPRASQ